METQMLSETVVVSCPPPQTHTKITIQEITKKVWGTNGKGTVAYAQLHIDLFNKPCFGFSEHVLKFCALNLS